MTALPVAEEFQVKREPVTPAQSPAPAPGCGQSVAMAMLNSGHRQVIQAGSQTRNQLLALGRVKAEDIPHRFMHCDGQQAEASFTLADEGEDLQTTELQCQTLSSGRKRNFATHCGDREALTAGEVSPDLHRQPNFLLPGRDVEETKSSVYHSSPQSASSRQRKCSAITQLSQPSFSEVPEGWVTWSPHTESGFEAKTRNLFSEHCVQDNYCDQKYRQPSKSSVDGFPLPGFLHPPPRKEAGCFKVPEVGSTRVARPEWEQNHHHIKDLTCTSPDHQWLVATASCHSASRQAVPPATRRKQDDMLSMAISSGHRASTATSETEEAMPIRGNSRAAAFFVPPPASHKSQHVRAATPRLDRRSSEPRPSPTDTTARPPGSRLGKPGTSGTRADLCLAPVSSDSTGNISAAPAAKQTSVKKKKKETSITRIQQKLNAYLETTKVSHWICIYIIICLSSSLYFKRIIWKWGEYVKSKCFQTFTWWILHFLYSFLCFFNVWIDI